MLEKGEQVIEILAFYDFKLRSRYETFWERFTNRHRHSVYLAMSDKFIIIGNAGMKY